MCSLLVGAELVERAVAAGQAAGLPFTLTEAEAWLAARAASDKHGEWSDVQQEGVAGGKLTKASATEPEEWIRPPMWMNRS